MSSDNSSSSDQIEREPQVLDEHADIDAELQSVGEPALEAERRWRVAESLKLLRQQINELAPSRSKVSDGTIGDAAHASRNSDHNPWVVDAGTGVVTALDVTHDPRGGCDAGLLAETLRQSRDPRLKYIISNSRIASSAPKNGAPAWAWRAYAGRNPHTKHCHISVQPEKHHFDSTAAWSIAAAFGRALESDIAENPIGEIEAGLEALIGDAAASDAPILARLDAVGRGVEILMTRYAEVTKAKAETPLEAAPAFEQLQGEYERLFATCTVRAEKAGEVGWYRKMLLRGRARYEEAQVKTGVPWWFIGITHGMEAGFNFAGHLHNGDPLSARTVQVPKGRPPVWNPPSDWLSSAIDALQYEGFLGKSDWSIAKALYRWEKYNGFGYRPASIGIPSPYLWSFSNHYLSGKYVADGSYSKTAISKQCGTAVMLKALAAAGDI